MLGIDLTGRKALVTGGARGIGAGVVRGLARSGAQVAFTYLGSDRGDDAAERLLAEFNQQEERVTGHIAPAQDWEAMEQVTSAVAERMGGLDILVPNAGTGFVAPLEELELSGWKRVLDINLTGQFIAVKAALPRLLEANRADVVLIGSSGVLDGGGGGVHYTSSKAGLEGLMRGMMRERLPSKGVHVNIVHPCVVDTDLLRTRYDTEEKRAQLAAQVPVGRLSRPMDIGALVAFLCSDLGGFICGQSIHVDGGRLLWRERQ